MVQRGVSHEGMMRARAISYRINKQRASDASYIMPICLSIKIHRKMVTIEKPE